MKSYLRRFLAAICTAALLVTAASALTVEQAVDLLEEYYVDELPAAAYEAQTMDELFAAVGDPYTYYMNEDEYRAFLGSVEGSESYVGIGVSVTYAETGIVINSIIPGGSAEEAGLKPGDAIIAIDGAPCVPAQESDVSRISGPEGTMVDLTILHTDGTQEEFTLVRRSFTAPTLMASLLDNGSGYIDCDSFASNTGELFINGVNQYDSQTDLWLVDLRSNPGGRTDSAITSAGVFTGQGYILYLRDGKGQYYPGFNFDHYLTEAPAVVLTNMYSASASEVFASAIRDYGAGIIVGGRTYGKGVAQILLDGENDPELFDGDAIKITAYRFYSGAGNTTDGVGVLPTLLIRDLVINDVAQMLYRREPEDPEGWLRLTLAGWQFYVDAPTAQETTAGQAALSELFAALPPDVPVEVYTEAGWLSLNAPMAATYSGVEYRSRWFNDVADSSYADELNTLAVYGILQGDGTGAYNPEKMLTRAELCALLCQTLGRVSQARDLFPDVAADSWYAPYVTTMYDFGLVKGKGDGNFGPDDPLTQQEFITILGRLAGFLNTNCYDLLSIVTSDMVTDPALAGFADWARDCAWLLSSGYHEQILEETGTMLCTQVENIDPTAPVSREEAGASLYQVLTVLGLLRY